MYDLVDSHVHLDAGEFDPDRAAVIERARRAGVGTMVIPGVDQASWPRIGALCADHAGVFAAFGLHPLFLAHDAFDQVEVLDSWLDTNPAVAIGEIGLDFRAQAPDQTVQRDIFSRQLQLARQRDLPVIVHALRAVEEVSLMLRDADGMRGVVHSFSGSAQQASRLWDLGFHLGIGGPVTYPRAQRLRHIVAHMPAEFLLLESDAPDQPDADHRGQRNEPARVAGIAQCIAGLRNESVEALVACTTANARRLFGLTGPAPAAGPPLAGHTT